MTGNKEFKMAQKPPPKPQPAPKPPADINHPKPIVR